MRKLLSYLWMLMLGAMGCTSYPEHPVVSAEQPPIFPDYRGVTIPEGIAPLNFDFAGDSDPQVMDVVAVGGKGGALHVNGRYAYFDVDKWHDLVHQNVGDSIRLTVCVKKQGAWTQYQPFYIHVSTDALPEWGLTYRRVAPGYDAYGSMGLYQRDLSNFTEKPLFENKNVDLNCVNCHTTNQGRGDQFTFHVRGKYGATIVGNEGQQDVLAPRNEALNGGLVYPYWHPSGQFIAYSTNETHQNFHQLNNLRVEVYDLKSDIVLYRPTTHEIMRDSILADPDVLENYPAFSPDGKWLYFSAAARVDSVWKNYADVKYNICRISFDEATGQFGTIIETMVDARSMGKSANMPRISPDGKYLLYTLCDYGCFPIWHPESDQWMMEIESGESYPLTEANSSDADSFHHWSQSSRWFVFTSRRDDGLYTNLYLAHVDREGRVSKPFCLPQEHPKEYFAETVHSFNTPAFVQTEIRRNPIGLYGTLLEEKRILTQLVNE